MQNFALARKEKKTMVSSSRLQDRRAFLSFPAASPILAYAGFSSRWVEDLMAEPLPPQCPAGEVAPPSDLPPSGMRNPHTLGWDWPRENLGMHDDLVVCWMTPWFSFPFAPRRNFAFQFS